MNQNKNVLIIGIDSLLGRNLSKIYNKNGWNVFGTSRRENNNNNNIIYFEFGNNINDLFLDNYQVCIICASVTSLEECEKNPLKTMKINVSNTIEIIKECNKLNLFTIFLSSDLVFSGNKIFPDIYDEENPNTKYGNFKLEVEKFIKSLNPSNFSILRFTKIISEETLIFMKWSKYLNNNLNIEVFDDVYISPIGIQIALKIIYEISKYRYSGTYQLGGNMILSYFEFAKIYYKEKGLNTNLIIPVSSNEKIIYHRCSSLKTYLPNKLLNSI